VLLVVLLQQEAVKAAVEDTRQIPVLLEMLDLSALILQTLEAGAVEAVVEVVISEKELRPFLLDTVEAVQEKLPPEATGTQVSAAEAQEALI
jgi:hypothetical protein